jgi:NADH-quinone oxidoreductase subunit E
MNEEVAMPANASNALPPSPGSSPEEAPDLTPLDRVLDSLSSEPGALIAMLQRAQEIYGYLPPPVLRRIADRADYPLSEIYGVATFYSQFYLTRRGKRIIRQCDGTACHVRGAARIIDVVERELGISPGETTPDNQYTFEVVYCLGSCGLAPVTVMDDRVEGRMEPHRMLHLLRQSSDEP